MDAPDCKKVGEQETREHQILHPHLPLEGSTAPILPFPLSNQPQSFQALIFLRGGGHFALLERKGRRSDVPFVSVNSSVA
jgi:hypothetical protein